MPRRRLLASTIVLTGALLLSACIVRPPTDGSAPIVEAGADATPAAEAPASGPSATEPTTTEPTTTEPTPQVIQVADPLEAEAYSAYEFFLLVERGFSSSPVLDSRELEGVATSAMAVSVVAEVQFLRDEGAVLDGAPWTLTFELLDSSTPDAPVAHVCADVSGVAVLDVATGAELVSGDELGMGEVLIRFERGASGRLLVDSRTPVLEHERTCV